MQRKAPSSKPTEWIAIGTTSGDVIVWDMLQAEAVVTMVIKPGSRLFLLIFVQSSSDPVICLCCHGDSVYSGHSGGQVRLWNITSSTMLKYVTGHRYSLGLK